MEKYNFKQIEEKWQNEWESKKLFNVKPEKNKKKCDFPPDSVRRPAEHASKKSACQWVIHSTTSATRTGNSGGSVEISMASERRPNAVAALSSVIACTRPSTSLARTAVPSRHS